MARRPFSLSAYLAFAGRRAPGTAPFSGPAARPRGPLVWLHAGSVPIARALATLAQRLAQQVPEIAVLRTGAWEDGAQPLPPENLPDAQRFLDAWRPALCLWASTTLNPALLWSAKTANIPLLHADPGGDAHAAQAPRWLPDPVPGTLALFDTIFTPDAAAERRLPRVMTGALNLQRTGPLTETTLPLDCDETQHEDLLTALAGRPVWLAARLQQGEPRAVIEAHARAVRLAHRLLLAMVPETEAAAAEMRAMAEASDLRLCRWSDGDFPDENAQVVLCDGPADLGLWYRLAPLSFLGGSLSAGTGGTDPLEAAALGTAILYGPNVGRYLASYTRLVEVGAARIVRDVDSLSGAVSQLVAPDRAAAMAHAGWDVVSEGAGATDAVIERIAALLDAAPRRTPA
ncbi:3-deoxy-D-manno-octulosonic acid transferase [Roseivivax isoporae]|uniref:3-deoxy-D-manno-octulosonic acid transferase n=1 Tax=Roseivivax isoporae LMG 25204 TaxID=1449351 RepID=X7F6Q5_9RHOB|nr:glycosyltransferase N-terminal domain-containing protein [Roseivivax isoporae]ETX28475.1 3-deoxy-D-manno-octulosonic acid transferase [Roseivivax isoporae LMG 25204]